MNTLIPIQPDNSNKISAFSYSLKILNKKLDLLEQESSVKMPSGKSFYEHPSAASLYERLRLQLEGKPYKHIAYTSAMAGLNELLYIFAKPIVDTEIASQ